MKRNCRMCGRYGSKLCRRCRARERSKRHRCERCGYMRSVPEEILPAGRVCIECKKVVRAESARRRYVRDREHRLAQIKAWTEAHPDRHREIKRAYNQRRIEQLRSDPKAYAAYLEQRRMDRRLARERAGKPSQPVPETTRSNGDYNRWQPAQTGNHVAPMVPAQPLASWLQREFPGWPVKRLADRLGEDDAHLRRLVLGEQQVVSLHIADRIFVNADCTHMLAVLYPPEEQ